MTLKWHRRGDHYVEQRGRYRIDKHIVDDREYDGGYLLTHWILNEYSGAQGFVPLDVHSTLRAAKLAAERTEAVPCRRCADEASEGPS
jgi:hypothetical protein